jgi:hypothetical protein
MRLNYEQDLQHDKVVELSVDFTAQWFGLETWWRQLQEIDTDVGWSLHFWRLATTLDTCEPFRPASIVVESDRWHTPMEIWVGMRHLRRVFRSKTAPREPPLPPVAPVDEVTIDDEPDEPEPIEDDPVHQVNQFLDHIDDLDVDEDDPIDPPVDPDFSEDEPEEEEPEEHEEEQVQQEDDHDDLEVDPVRAKPGAFTFFEI